MHMLSLYNFQILQSGTIFKLGTSSYICTTKYVLDVGFLTNKNHSVGIGTNYQSGRWHNQIEMLAHGTLFSVARYVKQRTTHFHRGPRPAVARPL